MAKRKKMTREEAINRVIRAIRGTWNEETCEEIIKVLKLENTQQNMRKMPNDLKERED